jgi:hypothetical protein
MNRMKQSDQIAARRFCRLAVGIPGKLRSVRLQQQSTLLLQAFDSCCVELFIRVHTLVYVFSRSKVLSAEVNGRTGKGSLCDQLAVSALPWRVQKPQCPAARP